jgi:hypothetical protein
MRIAHKILVGKFQEKRPLVSRRCRFQNDIKMILQYECQHLEWGGRGLFQDRPTTQAVAVVD